MNSFLKSPPWLRRIVLTSFALLAEAAHAVPKIIDVATWAEAGSKVPLNLITGVHPFNTQDQTMGGAGVPPFMITVSSGPSLRPNWQYELSVDYGDYQFLGTVTKLELLIDQQNPSGPITGFFLKDALGAPYPGASGEIIFDGMALRIEVPSALLIVSPILIVQWNQSVPSRCEGDVDASGAVDVDDLLAVITGWGACALPCLPPCIADVNASCAVDVDDLLAVITAWGRCP